jgi:branched-chain amino acid transport system substrate-binding protein
VNSSNPKTRIPDSAMILRRLFTLLTFFCVLHGASSARQFSQLAGQDTVVYKPAVERNFQEALRLFREHRYGQAGVLFHRILAETEITHRTSASYLMESKSLYHLGEYRSSVTILQEFLRRFEKSEYIDDAEYTLGLDFYQTEQYMESARSFLVVCQTTTDTVLAMRAVKMLRLVASSNLEIGNVRALLREATRADTKGQLTLVLAGKVHRTGDTNGAKELLRSVLTLPPTDPLAIEARAMMEGMDRGGVVRIGVVLPLTTKSDQSSASGLGQDLLDGMNIAVAGYNSESIPKVNLEVRDSERDGGVAARQVSELAADDRVVAIVGPVFSNEVFSSAGIANRRGVPLITPTATSTGIAAIGDYVFQANPDFVVRGQAMAQYAALVLGAKNFAVLASADTVDKLIADAFSREVKELGGTLVDAQSYSPGQTDLRDELMTMRKRGMELSEPTVVNFGAKIRPADIKRMAQWGVPQQVLDSLTVSSAVANVESLFGPGGTHIADSLKIPTQRIKAKYDSLAYPVTSIDVMFVSISSSEEIGIVTPQLRYFNFQTQILGTGNWNDPAELDQNRQYANGVVFSTDAYWEEVSGEYQKFAAQYRSKFAKDPSVNAMIGYDAMSLLLRAVRQGAVKRDALLRALKDGSPYQGVHAKINFDRRRVNACLTLLQFKGRVIKKIGEIDVSRRAITGIE